MGLALAWLTVIFAAAQGVNQARWKLSPHPIQIAGRTNDDTGLLGRVVGLTRLRNGSLIVADGQSLALYRFDTSGRSLGTIGRAGAGPGEFRTILSMRRCAGDSLLVYDPSLFRITVFSAEGSYVRTITLADAAGDGPPPYDFFCNKNGILAFLHRSLAPPGGIGPRRPQVAVTITQPNGKHLTLGTFPASERYFNGSEDFARPLGRRTSVALGRNTIHIGTGDHVDSRDSVRIIGYSLQGDQSSIIRDRFPGLPVTAKRLTSYIEQRVGRRAGREAETRNFYRSLEYPTMFPAYGAVLVDATEYVWVEESPLPSDSIGVWRVYSPEGTHQTSIRMPKRFQLMEVGSDYVAGVWRDEMDAETVRVYRLVKED